VEELEHCELNGIGNELLFFEKAQQSCRYYLRVAMKCNNSSSSLNEKYGMHAWRLN